MKRVLQALTVFFFCIILIGCFSSSVKDMEAKVKDAKTEQDVLKALGEPDEKGGGGIAGVASVGAWTYKASDGTVVVTFANGKVAGVAYNVEKK